MPFVKFPRALAAAPLVLFLALFATACVSTENPSGWAAPVFEGETIYFLASHDRLASAPAPTDAGTTIAWSFPDKNNKDQSGFKLQGVYGEPVVEGDSIYLTSYSGGVFALNKATGVPRWRVKPGDISGNVVGGAAVNGDLLVFGTTDGHLYGINKSDGSTASGWPKGGLAYGDGFWATPIMKGDTLYVADMGGNLRALGVADRSEKWKFHTTGAIAEIDLLEDGRLFVPSLNKHVYLVDSASGDEKGDFATSDWVWTRPAVKDGIAYFGDFGGDVYALDITTDTPKQVWKYSTGGARVKAGPQIVDDVVVVADRKPAVHFLNAKDGSLLNKVPIQDAGTFRADLVAHGGMVYAGSTNGHLLRADPKSRAVIDLTVGGRQ